MECGEKFPMTIDRVQGSRFKVQGHQLAVAVGSRDFETFLWALIYCIVRLHTEDLERGPKFKFEGSKEVLSLQRHSA
jgi:hypothetical protein